MASDRSRTASESIGIQGTAPPAPDMPPTTSHMPQPTERFANYASTIIDIIVPDGAAVSVLPGRPPPARLTDLLPLLVITAWNPGDARPGVTANRAANEELRTRLQDLAQDAESVTILSAVGRAPDSSHSEESIAVHGIARDAAIVLGRQMRQDAIFEITTEGVTVVPCNA
jgi:hypothetical protein